MIVIVDYGLGNLGSVLNMLKKVGASAIISSQEKDILTAEKIIIPGVGAFDQGMRELQARALVDPLNEMALQKKVPILGICLGMQLFTQSSEEGTLPGLGWIEAKTIRFQFSPSSDVKVPHMGWNQVVPKTETAIFKDFKDDSRFYFVHSYYVTCSRANDAIAKSKYGHEFTCAIQSDNIFGVQFHPEKSHRHGLRLLKNFSEM